MKILRGILIGLFALVVIYLAASFFMPKKLYVKETVTINAPAELIYKEVTDFHTWDKWSPWNQMDSNMQNAYSEKTGVVGSWTSWESEIIGNGRQEIVEAEKPVYAKYAMNFGESNDSNYAVFQLEELQEGVTKVSWSMDGAELPFYKRPMNVFMEPLIKDNYTKGLEALKAEMESRSEEMQELKANERTGQIQIIEMEPVKILAIKDSTTSEGISNKLAEIYSEISDYINSTENVELNGMPLAIYHYYSKDKVILEAGLPYRGEAEESGRIRKIETSSGKTAMKVHYGSYASSEVSHEEIYRYLQENHFEIAGAPWEVYANDPSMVTEDEIQTNIYYPILE